MALGEGSHGTHEFITVRDRITRFLIQERGFTIVAVEGDWGTAKAVDEYVRDGTGDGRDALLSIGWVTGTEEMLDLVDWMQLCNSVNAGVRVSFHGLDMKSPRESIQRVSAILEKIDARTAGEVRDLYSCFPTSGSIVDEFIRLGTAKKQACWEAVRQVYLRIEEKRSEYEALLSMEGYSSLLQEARVVVQNLECLAPIDCNRDSMMAENAAWLLEAGGLNAKIILWAHNGHVSDQVWRMGWYLRENFGDEMINVATTFFEGSFTAMETGGLSLSYYPQAFMGISEFEAAQAPEHTYEYYLNLADYPLFMLDLRGLTFEAPGTSWLEGPRGFRGIGCCASSLAPNRSFSLVKIAQEFDMVIFVHESNPSKPLIGGEK